MQEADKTNSHKIHHEDLCDAFTSTVSALAVDAAALRQLTSLRFAVGAELSTLGSEESFTDVPREDDENMHPNMMNRKYRSESDRPDVIENLCRIDEAVRALEAKMSQLHEIVSEEKKAIADLEDVKSSADQQRRVIEQIIEGCKDLRLPGDQLDHSVPQSALKHSSSKSDKKVVFSQPEEEQNENIDSDPIISLALVTESELNGISKNIRGRIHLSVINNALAEIERVCRTKYTILGKTFSKSSSGGIGKHSNRRERGATTSTIARRTKQYQQQLAAHRDVEVDEHGDRPWVSEQDLRDSCAFFRSGESTARSIILILRTLRRLKQVCGRNSQVTYVCLPPPNE